MQNKDRKDRQTKRPEGPIRFKTCFHNTIYDVLRQRGWKETDHETEWDFHWTDKTWIKEGFDHIHLEEQQRVNHFRNYYELARKDLLIKNVKRMKRQLERENKLAEAAEYNFLPISFVLPSEYSIFTEEFKKYPGAVWIMKPIGKSQGKGIFLFNKLNQISEWKKDHRWKSDTPQAEAYVVQKYIESPYLIGGKKFDLRIYVLVTCYNPLTVYLYRSGFGRFSQHRFSMNLKEIDNSYVHLTNVAVQKHSDHYNPRVGAKWDLRNLKLLLISRHGADPVNTLFDDMQMLIIRSLQAVQKIMINDKHCFELYGYDILIDANLKPWLLEVNASPSLTAETPSDYALKYGLLNDTITIIDMEKRLTGQEDHVGGFDIICRGEPIAATRNAGPSMLGCYFDRSKSIKILTQIQRQREEQRQEKLDRQQQQQGATITTTTPAAQQQQSEKSST